jgi:malonyl-CoA O-methyltransferase
MIAATGIAAVREFYNAKSSSYLTDWSQVERYSGVVRTAMKRYMLPRSRLLDVGCGPGQFTSDLPESIEVVGLDIAERMVDLARAARPTGSYLVHDYHEPLPAELGQFDLVLALGSLDFCRDLPLVVRHLAAVTRQGGHLLLTMNEYRAGVPGQDRREMPLLPELQPGLVSSFYSFKEMTDAILAAELLPCAYRHLPGWSYSQFEIHYALWELERPGGDSTSRLEPAEHWLDTDFPMASGPDIPLDRGIRLGSGWFPLERWNDETFRWASPLAELIIDGTEIEEARAVLLLRIESGPSVGGETLELGVLDASSREVDRIRLRGRSDVEVTLPVEPKTISRFYIRCDQKADAVPGDGRVLLFRVFSIASA